MRSLTNLAAAMTLSLASVAQAFAQQAVPSDVLPGSPTNAVTTELSFRDLLGFIVNWLISIAGGIALLFLIIGGIEYMTAGGSDDKVQRAKNTMRNAVIGLVVVLLSFFIIRNFVRLTFSINPQTPAAAVTLVPSTTSVAATATTFTVNCSGATTCPPITVTPTGPVTGVASVSGASATVAITRSGTAAKSLSLTCAGCTPTTVTVL